MEEEIYFDSETLKNLEKQMSEIIKENRSIDTPNEKQVIPTKEEKEIDSRKKFLKST